MTIRMILDGLNSSDAGKRGEAEKALRDMGPEAVKPLIGMAREEDSKPLIGLFLLSVIMAVPSLINRVSLFAPFAAKILYGIHAFISGSIGLLLLLRMRRGGLSILAARAKRAKLALLSLEDVRCIAPVCETLLVEKFHIPKLQEGILTNLLVKLKATDVSLLPPAATKRFYTFLQIDNAVHHADFLIAILRALEQVGDETAIPSVSGLANSFANTPNGIRVRTEAQHCLAALRERVGRMEFGKTLLRASVEPNDGQDNLLRPVAGHTEADEHLLLRVTDDIPQKLNRENKG
jgi:hypothetical protein